MKSLQKLKQDRNKASMHDIFGCLPHNSSKTEFPFLPDQFLVKTEQNLVPEVTEELMLCR